MPPRVFPIIVGIYLITSPSGRAYVGQSWDIYRRWRGHKNEKLSSTHIQRSLSKHGGKKHRFRILRQMPFDSTQDELNHWEKFYIQQFRAQGVKLMNLTEGGSNGKPTEETLVKLRRPKSKEHRANIAKAVAKQWAEGTKKPTILSPESRAKVGRALKGRKYSAERVAKASNWERTPEYRAKISRGLRGRSSTLKLTPNQVVEIRTKYVPRIYSLRKLGAEYGVDGKTIHAVVTGKTHSQIL